MYRQAPSPNPSIVINSVQRLSDHAWIPFDPANKDYQEYLEWFEKGNTPLPAEDK
jgi:hypothetical protein